MTEKLFKASLLLLSGSIHALNPVSLVFLPALAGPETQEPRHPVPA
jgi:hypothetical protein